METLKHPSLARQYLSELVAYGGQQTTRGAMIRDLYHAARGQRFLVEVYLRGHARQLNKATGAK